MLGFGEKILGKVRIAQLVRKGDLCDSSKILNLFTSESDLSFIC